jgi:hypothetical protein
MAILNQIGGISTGGLTGALEGPLSALFGNKSGVQMFQYPRDLGNNPSRMHIIQFEIRNVIPRHFEVASEETLDNFTETLSSAFTSSTSRFSSESPEITQTDIGKTTSFYVPGPDVTKNVSAYLQSKTTKNAAIVNLYMPETLTANYNQSYNELTLSDATGGFFGAGAASLSAGKSALEGYQKGGFSGAFGALGQSESIADITTAATQSGLFSGLKDVNDLFLKTQAKALNPQIQLLYRGVGLREFTMEFMFTPKSKEEADQVTAIVNTFVYASSPAISGVGGMYFIPPSELKINFLMAKSGNFSALSDMLQKAGNGIVSGLGLGTAAANYLGGNQGTENDRLFKIGSCVLTNVSVDYAPNGWAAHENGAPVQTRMTLSFQENEVIDRNRLKSGAVR